MKINAFLVVQLFQKQDLIQLTTIFILLKLSSHYVWLQKMTKTLRAKGFAFPCCKGKQDGGGKRKKKGDFTYFITFIVLAAIKIFASQTKISRIVIFEPSYSFFAILNSST